MLKRAHTHTHSNTVSRCQVQQNLVTLQEIAKEDPHLVLPPVDQLQQKGYLTQTPYTLDVDSASGFNGLDLSTH